MNILRKSDLLSIYGGKNSKECEKLRKEIMDERDKWDTAERDSKIQEWSDKCSN